VGGFKHFLIFTPMLGEDSHFDSYFWVGSTTNQTRMGSFAASLQIASFTMHESPLV